MMFPAGLKKVEVPRIFTSAYRGSGWKDGLRPGPEVGHGIDFFLLKDFFRIPSSRRSPSSTETSDPEGAPQVASLQAGIVKLIELSKQRTR
jgi:hypothetical protein